MYNISSTSNTFNRDIFEYQLSKYEHLAIIFVQNERTIFITENFKIYVLCYHTRFMNFQT